MEKGSTKDLYTIEEVMTLLHIHGGLVPPQRVVIATLGVIRKLKTEADEKQETKKTEKHSS